jgi:O-antigen/teichoic acid export membrane protein
VGPEAPDVNTAQPLSVASATPELARPGVRSAPRLATTSALLFGARVLGAATTYLAQVCLARWMGGEELGRYVNAFSWCLLLSTLALLGLPSAALRFIGAAQAAARPGLVAGLLRRGSALVLGCALCIAVLAAASVLLGSSTARQSGPLLVACLGIPLFALLRFHSGIAHGFSWFSLYFLPNNVLRPLAFLAVLGGLALAGASPGATGAMLAHVAVIAALALVGGRIVCARVARELGAVEPEYQTRQWLRTAAPLAVVSLVTGFYPELNVILVGCFRPPAEVAVFSACFRTAFLIAFVLTAIDAALLPSTARLAAAGERAELQRLVARATRARFACALACVLGIIVLGRQVLALFGPEFTSGYATLCVLALSLLVRAASGPLAELLGVTGHHDASLKVSVACLVAMVIAGLLLVPPLGILGAALGVLAVTIGTAVWLHVLCVRHLGIAPSLFTRAP